MLNKNDKNTGHFRAFRLSDKVYEDLQRLKKKGQSWDFLFEYLIECYWYRKEKVKGNAKLNLFKRKK